MKKLFDKIGAFVCRGLLNTLQSSDGTLNKVKIGLLVSTFVLYSAVFSWKFALLIMISIGWHESGHLWAMRRVGLTTKGFYFIPFMGGIAVSDGYYKSLSDKVVVAIMGPIWGMLLALATWFVYLVTDIPIIGYAAYWQALINIFNLMPVNPLDGGLIARSVLRSFNKVVADIFSIISTLACALLCVKTHSVVFGFLTILSARDFWVHYKQGIEDPLPKLSKVDIVKTVVAYSILCATLLTIVAFTSFLDGQIVNFLKN
jgi:putative peptide zinc metalloprotease protein